MKNDIHPTYHKNVTISCACGASFVTGSTRDDIKVEICSACHPFYTGKQKLVDTAGRVDKFRAKMEASRKMKEELAKKNAKKVEVAPKSEEIDSEKIETKEK